MALDPAKSPPPSKAWAIVQRSRGRTHGPATRLMSPSDLGEILKPFVFLDFSTISDRTRRVAPPLHVAMIHWRVAELGLTFCPNRRDLGS
jgi:hypothetical protein